MGRSPFGEEMDKRKAHLEALPAWQLREDLEALKRCFYVFNTNANELATHVASFLKSSQIAEETSDGYVDELVRRLHNYLGHIADRLAACRHEAPVAAKGFQGDSGTLRLLRASNAVRRW